MGTGGIELRKGRGLRGWARIRRNDDDLNHGGHRGTQRIRITDLPSRLAAPAERLVPKHREISAFPISDSYRIGISAPCLNPCFNPCRNAYVRAGRDRGCHIRQNSVSVALFASLWVLVVSSYP